MVAQAATLAAPLFLGERGGYVAEEKTTEEWVRAVPRIERGAAGLGLTSLAAEIECGRMRVVEEGDLEIGLKTRVGLRTLRRRAEKRGYAPVIRCTSVEFRSVARAAGWQTEMVIPAAPPAAGDAALPRPLARLAGLRPAQRGSATPEPPLASTIRTAAGGVRVHPGLLGAVPVVVLVGTLLFPHASVSVVPVTEVTQIEVPITVDPSLKKADPATGRLPGRSITKEVADTLSAPATGRRTVPDAKATGEIVLLNKSEAAVAVPKGTIVLAGSVKFATQTDVTIAPSRRAGSANIFGMATARVQAVTGGPAGNVERNKIDRIQGPLAAALTVQNGQPTRGGTERAATFVTEDDRKKLEEQLYRTLAERLNQQVKKELPANEKESLIAWSGQNPAIVESVFSKNAEEEAPNVSLTLKLRYGATAFSNDAYNQLVRDLAGKASAPTKPGYSVAPDSVQPEAPSLAGADNGSVKLIGRARATVTADVDSGKLRAALAGKPLGEARAYLAEVPGVTSHSLNVVSFLPGKMPLIGWRIGVQSRPAA